jgi:hypothetical protein
MNSTDKVIRVTPDDMDYEVMFASWMEQRQPGYIDFGGVLWKVGQRHEDNAVVFLRQGTNEDFYTSRSTKGIAK